MKTRAIFVVPFVVAIAIHGWASGAWAQDAVVAALLLVAIPLGGRVRASSSVQRGLAAIFFVAGAAMGWAHLPELGYGPGTLPRAGSLVALGALLAAVSRFYVRAPWDGERATFVLGLLAVAACGTTKLGPIYGVAAGVYLALSLAARRLRDEARAPLRYAVRNAGASILGLLAIAAMVSMVLLRVIPIAHDAVERRLERADLVHDVVGFGSGAWLGSIRTMVTSDEEVLRVAPPPHAAPIDYLRGAVYDEYRDDGRWGESGVVTRFRDVDAPSSRSADPSLFHVRRVSGDATRYFVPLRARALSTASGMALTNAAGVARTTRDSRATTYGFALGDRDTLALAPPTDTDLGVPRVERAPLAKLARRWTAGATTDDAKVAAIREHLAREYGYSLSFAHDADDPLLDFLFTSKVGYCTYFASAMTLLARVEGVPARMVAGYRVGEWDPLTGEWIVREKNAHAWVEAWVDGGWRTVDATPMTELPQNAPHRASVGTLLADAFSNAESAIAYAVTHVTPLQLLVVLAGLGALLAAVRALRARAGRRRASFAVAALQGALPFYDELAAAIARGHAGFAPSARAESESLERFSNRLRAAENIRAADLVDRYAALRYGGAGDGRELERDVARFLTPARRGA